MKSLFDGYATIRKSYYGILVDPNVLFGGVDTECSCRRFIEEHFEKGRKSGVFEIDGMFEEEYIRNGKHCHTVSLYLLGLYLQDIFGNAFLKIYPSLFDNYKWCDIEYSWYLTCLYHDVISCIERNISHMELVAGVAESALFTHQPMKKDVVLTRFSKEVVMNYLKYREKRSRVEHGIVGGTLLFDKLTQSFENETRNHDWSISSVYRAGTLEWRREHLDHFAYIADAVCCHNIWMVSDDDKEKSKEYEEAGLRALIINNPADRLNMWTYPLQFMLCLLDTIEPVKRFETLGVEAVLKNIYIEEIDEGIRIEWTNAIKSHPSFLKWLMDISALSAWMAVNVTSCQYDGERCGLRITIVK